LRRSSGGGTRIVSGIGGSSEVEVGRFAPAQQSEDAELASTGWLRVFRPGATVAPSWFEGSRRRGFLAVPSGSGAAWQARRSFGGCCERKSSIEPNSRPGEAGRETLPLTSRPGEAGREELRLTSRPGEAAREEITLASRPGEGGREKLRLTSRSGEAAREEITLASRPGRAAREEIEARDTNGPLVAPACEENGSAGLVRAIFSNVAGGLVGPRASHDQEHASGGGVAGPSHEDSGPRRLREERRPLHDAHVVACPQRFALSGWAPGLTDAQRRPASRASGLGYRRFR
jgi:hypothetical protein